MLPVAGFNPRLKGRCLMPEVTDRLWPKHLINSAQEAKKGSISMDESMTNTDFLCRKENVKNVKKGLPELHEPQEKCSSCILFKWINYKEFYFCKQNTGRSILVENFKTCPTSLKEEV